MKQVLRIFLIYICFKASSAEIIKGFEFGDNKADKHYIEKNNGHILFNIPVKKFDEKN